MPHMLDSHTVYAIHVGFTYGVVSAKRMYFQDFKFFNLYFRRLNVSSTCKALNFN